MEREKNKVFRRLVPKGFLKSYILLILRNGPLHGYSIIQKIKEKTGFWAPSPGTIYPTLHTMVKNGLIKETGKGERRKKYMLTKKGEKLADEVTQVENRMKKEASEVLSKIIDVDKEELMDFFNNYGKEINKNPLYHEINKLLNNLRKISEDPEKVIKARKILEETNTELKKILRKKVKGR